MSEEDLQPILTTFQYVILGDFPWLGGLSFYTTEQIWKKGQYEK